MIIDRIKPSVIKICDIFIMPGYNTIPKDKEDEFKNDSQFQANIEAGTIRIVEKVETPKTDEQGKADISEMNAKDAVKYVKGCLNKKELEVMLENEERKSVVNSIEVQLEQFEDENDDNE